MSYIPFNGSSGPTNANLVTWVLDDGHASPPPGVFGSWQDLMDAIADNPDIPRRVQLASKSVAVPAGSYDLGNTCFFTKADQPAAVEMDLLDAQLFGNFESRGHIDWKNKNTTVPVITVVGGPIQKPRIILREGSRLLQDAATTQYFMEVPVGEEVTLDMGDGCSLDPDGAALEVITVDGTLNLIARDNAKALNNSLKAAGTINATMIGPEAVISTNQTGAPYPNLTVIRSEPRLSDAVIPIGVGPITLGVEDLDMIYVNTSGGGTANVALPPAAAATGRRVTFKNDDNSATTTNIAGDSGETVDGQNPYTIGGAGLEIATIVSDGSQWWVISKA